MQEYYFFLERDIIISKIWKQVRETTEAKIRRVLIPNDILVRDGMLMTMWATHREGS